MGRIKRATHGTRPLEFKCPSGDLSRADYRSWERSSLPPSTPAFAISHGVLFADLVDLKDQNPKAYPPYDEMARDVIGMIDSDSSR